MPRSRNTEVEETVEEVAVEETTEEVTPEEKTHSKDVVTVVWRLGSREYSRADHGPEFKLLAAEFAKKNDGKVV